MVSHHCMHPMLFRSTLKEERNEYKRQKQRENKRGGVLCFSLLDVTLQKLLKKQRLLLNTERFISSCKGSTEEKQQSSSTTLLSFVQARESNGFRQNLMTQSAVRFCVPLVIMLMYFSTLTCYYNIIYIYYVINCLRYFVRLRILFFFFRLVSELLGSLRFLIIVETWSCYRITVDKSISTRQALYV